MAVKQIKQPLNYGFDNPLQNMNPLTIVSQRAPTAADIAEIGCFWVDKSADAVYCLTSITAGAAVWTTSPASGVGTFTSVTVNPGDIDVTAGDVNIDAGNLAVTAGNVTIGGDLAVTGNVTITGDFDITDTASISLTSTNDAARAIYLHANGGTSETIELHSDQGTGVDSIFLNSDVGGITVSSGLASADAINIVNSVAGGGIDIDGGTAGIAVDTTGAFSIDGATASNLSVTGAGQDLTVSSVGGSLILSSTENIASAIQITATVGGIDISAAGASAGEDIDIVATGSSVNVTSTEDAAQAIYLRANGGTSETIQIHADQGTGVASINILSDVGGVTISGGVASADAVNIVSANAGGGIDIDAGTAGIAIDSTGSFSIDGAAASNVTTTGAGIDLTLSSVLGSVLVSSTEDAALAIRLHANGGTSETIQLHSDQGTGVGSINLLSDVGGITLTSTGLASADAINIEANAGGIDMDAALQINIASGQNAANAIRIIASAGGIDIDAVGAAGEDIAITNTGGSVTVEATEAVADAIVLNASNAAGGIDLLTGGGEISIAATGGNVSMLPGTDSVAGTTATINARVGVATFTGLTTAAGADVDLTITNSVLAAGAGVFVTVSNLGTNDADITVEGVNTQTAGSLVLHCINSGPAALNGDIVATFWIIN